MKSKVDTNRFTEFMLIGFVWLLLIVAPVFFRRESDLSWLDVLNMAKTLVPLFVIFLINRFYLVPHFLFRKQNLVYVLLVVVLVLSLTLVLWAKDSGPRPQLLPLQEQQIQGPPPPDMRLQGPPPDLQMEQDRLPGPPAGPQNQAMPPFLNLLIFSFLLVGFDTGLMAAFRLEKSEKEKARLEKQNTETQLAFLKNQVSPHFFMNTLNNIHALIDVNSEEAKDAVIRLSKLMRHLIYDSENKSLPIKKELEFIRNYIDLMRLRFSDRVKISLEIPDKLPDKNIPPLLFTSYIENAFKHGISYREESSIRIAFVFDEENLFFAIENTKPKAKESIDENGIGISNSRRRLDLLYKNKYQLEVNDQSSSYKLKLRIPL